MKKSSKIVFFPIMDFTNVTPWGGARGKIRALARAHTGARSAKHLRFLRANKGEWPRDHAFAFFDSCFMRSRFSIRIFAPLSHLCYTNL